MNKQGITKSVSTLKNLGQSGARKLQSFMLSKNARCLKESGLTKK